MDVPLLNGGRPKAGGGQEYAAQLNTTDGAEYVLCATFDLPVRGGVADLGAAAGFDPRKNLLTNIVQLITRDRLAARGHPGAQDASPVIEVEGGALVVLAHVAAVQYLGPVVGREGPRLTVALDGGDSLLRIDPTRLSLMASYDD